MEEPITKQITRRVDPDLAYEFEDWVSRGIALMPEFKGYLGAGWVRSSAGSNTWHVIYRFTTEEAMRDWESSPQRQRWASEFAGLMEEEAHTTRTGIEGWFNVQDPENPPPRWKQLIVIFTGFFPMSVLANWLLGRFVPADWPLVLRVFIMTICVMPVMIYFVLPYVTRLYGPWLTKEP